MLLEGKLYPVCRSDASKSGKKNTVFVVSFSGEKDATGLFKDCGTVSGWLPGDAAEQLRSGNPIKGKIDINGDFVMLKSVTIGNTEYTLGKEGAAVTVAKE